MRKKHIFAIDKNLDLAIESPIWQQYFQKFSIVPSLYTDMQQLTEKMKNHKALVSYLPTANFFYFRSDSVYIPIANALFSATRSCQNRAFLIVARKSSVDTIEDLKGKIYGYIHPYCTSSYFSIALLLWEKGFSIRDFFSSLKQVGAWQSQIDAVIAGEIDATMVSENVWQSLASNAEKTKIIAIKEHLPSPLVLVKKQVDPVLLSELKTLLFSYQQPPNRQSMFNGFAPFQKEQIEQFFLQAEKALKPRNQI